MMWLYPALYKFLTYSQLFDIRNKLRSEAIIVTNEMVELAKEIEKTAIKK